MAIPTLGDVLNYVTEKEVSIKLFGATADYGKGFYDFCSALGDVIAEEKGISREQAQELPHDTNLGEKAHKKFLEFQLWVLDNK